MTTRWRNSEGRIIRKENLLIPGGPAYRCDVCPCDIESICTLDAGRYKASVAIDIETCAPMPGRDSCTDVGTTGTECNYYGNFGGWREWRGGKLPFPNYKRGRCVGTPDGDGASSYSWYSSYQVKLFCTGSSGVIRLYIYASFSYIGGTDSYQLVGELALPFILPGTSYVLNRTTCSPGYCYCNLADDPVVEFVAL